LIWLTGGFHAAQDWIDWAEEETKELRAKKRTKERRWNKAWITYR